MICYLCGTPIEADEAPSGDHLVPAGLITREQPKVRGFDYGGVLPTHATCNNEFGDETYVAKALDLLRVLHQPSAWSPLQHREHPELTILPIDASALSHFTSRDLRFFKMHDARTLDPSVLSDPRHYANQVKTNPTRDALFVALSVLAKSAAAILVKRRLRAIPRFWRIYANAYTGDLKGLDFADVIGPSKPLDVELQAWIGELPDGNWHVVYAAKDVLVFFTYGFHRRAEIERRLTAAHSNAETLKFLGTSINELKTTGWRISRSPDS